MQGADEDTKKADIESKETKNNTNKDDDSKKHNDESQNNEADERAKGIKKGAT